MKTLATISSDFAAMARVAKALEVSELQLHTMEAWYKGRISKLLSRSRFGGTESLKLTPDGIIAHIVWNWEFPEYEDVLIPFRFFTEPDADKARADWETHLAAKAKAEQDKLNQTQAAKTEQDERATYERLRAKYAPPGDGWSHGRSHG